MNASTVFSDTDVSEGFEPYRSVSKAAVGSVILALLSIVPFCLWVTGTVAPAMLLLPLGGAVAGTLALRSIRRYPTEISGRIPAMLGLVVSAVLFVVGAGWQSYVYSTEVPDGYERIAFDTLKAGPRQADVPPAEAIDLNGRQVFIKGYIYPGQQLHGLRQFVLVPDLGTCCFGGTPKLTHMIEVTLTGDETVDYSMTKRKLGGVLKVNPSLQPVAGRPGVFYQLEADFAK